MYKMICFYGIILILKNKVVIQIKRLNIFIDESGDFGFVNGSSDLYAVSFTSSEKYFFNGKDFRHIINLLKKKRI